MSKPAAALPPAAHSPRIIRVDDGVARVVEDDWRVVRTPEEFDPQAPARVLLPLALALELGGRLPPAERVGIWLAPADDPTGAAALLPAISLIGVHFPVFTDGRGYSSAVLLRSRLGWRGPLRALGDVLQDQLFALRRVGFDSFALRADRDPHAALAGFSVFSGAYQASIDAQPLAGPMDAAARIAA